MSRPDGAGPAADDDVRPDDAQTEGPGDPVEVEYGGQTYAVPAALKGALMRHADYAEKMQVLAQHHQALEAGQGALIQAAEAQNRHLADHARLYGLQDQIARLSQMNWPALQAQNPDQARQLLHQLFQMRQAHEIAAAALQHRQAVHAFDSQRRHAAQVAQAHGVLAREIDGWSPQMAGELAQYALSQGIRPDELDAVSDPRLVRILHHARLGHAAEQKTSAAQRLAKAQAVRPAVEVGGTGGGPKDPNQMSTADWMSHRRGQLRTKAR